MTVLERLGAYRPSAHVDDLPVEVLRKIFIATYPQEMLERGPEASREESISLPCRLSHVSRYWRDVAIQQGELWSYLALTLEGDFVLKYPIILDIFFTFLERTNSSPINFRFRFFSPIPWDGEARNAVQSMISALLENQKRWKDVDFMWCGHRLPPDFRSLDITNMPLLKSLYLNVSLRTHDGMRCPTNIDISRSPQIEEMDLNGSYHLEIGESPKYELSKCVLQPPDHLSDSATAGMSLNILRLAPNLRYMKLNTMKPVCLPDTYDPAPPTTHSLVMLTLRYGFSSEMVIDHLCLPKLKGLAYCDGNTQFGGHAVLRMIQRSQPPLQYLSIHGIGIRDVTLIEILRLLPSLVELDIMGCSTTARLLRSLYSPNQADMALIGPENGEAVICPELRTLRLERIPLFHEDSEGSAADALIDMVDSRMSTLGTFNMAAIRNQGEESVVSLADQGFSLLKQSFQNGEDVTIETYYLEDDEDEDSDDVDDDDDDDDLED